MQGPVVNRFAVQIVPTIHGDLKSSIIKCVEHRVRVEELERSSRETVIVAPESVSDSVSSEFVAIALYPLSELADPILDPGTAEGHVLAYRSWLPNPSATIGVRLSDEAMHPILPAGSIVAVDRSVTDPRKLQGQIVAARPNGNPIIRWLEISGRHVILRPNQTGKEFPLIPIEFDPNDSQLVVGQVVWSWSRFAQH